MGYACNPRAGRKEIEALLGLWASCVQANSDSLRNLVSKISWRVIEKDTWLWPQASMCSVHMQACILIHTYPSSTHVWTCKHVYTHIPKKLLYFFSFMHIYTQYIYNIYLSSFWKFVILLYIKSEKQLLDLELNLQLESLSKSHLKTISLNIFI